MKVSERSIAGFYVSGTLAELHRDSRMGEAEYNRLVIQARAYLSANGKPDPFADPAISGTLPATDRKLAVHRKSA